jgi:Putative zinc-finger
MNCPEIRELAGPYVSEQLSAETVEALAAHLDGCLECAEEISRLRRLRAALRSAYLASPELAPGADFTAVLRSRLHAEARRHAPSRAASRRTWLALAAGLILLAGGGAGLRNLGMSGFTAILQAAVGDHLNCAVAFKLLERPIALARAAERYDDPVDRSLETIQPSSAELSGGPLKVLERHSCVFEGRRFAHIVLRYKHELISVVVTPDGRWLRHVPGAAPPNDGQFVVLSPVDGMHVTAWRGPDHVAFAISALSDGDLLEVTRSMAAPVAVALRAE